MNNGHTHMTRNTQQHVHEDLGENFQNLHINSQAQTRESEPPSSARSRQTMFSNVSKKRANGLYKLGSKLVHFNFFVFYIEISMYFYKDREDIRLPRYLEKEKREKEEERVRELSRDPNCPLGHYALAEEERLAALNSAQKSMS